VTHAAINDGATPTTTNLRRWFAARSVAAFSLSRKGTDMDWLALVQMLLTTLLPLILVKGPAASKTALQRKAVRYARIADAATDPMAAFALGEAADLCNCLAVAETAEAQSQLLAAAQDGFAGVQRAMAAGKGV